MPNAKHIAPQVGYLPVAIVNAYLVGEPGAWTLVDTGIPNRFEWIKAACENRFGKNARPEAIVLTHAHFDHIGFAERARVELGIPVWVHENDASLTKRPWLYMSERSPLAYLGPKTLPIVSSFIRAGAPRVKPIREVRRFGNEGSLDVPGSPLVLFTPGHTLGHCALHLPERDVVISGDALVTHDPYTDTRGPRIVARGATADNERALASLELLAGTGVGTLLPGHSEPWTGGAERAVQEARRVGVL